MLDVPTALAGIAFIAGLVVGATPVYAAWQRETETTTAVIADKDRQLQRAWSDVGYYRAKAANHPSAREGVVLPFERGVR